jgi:hypothetical protein
MRRWLTLIAVACALGVPVLSAPAASAAPGSATAQILSQCSSGQISGHFTLAQLQHALAVMSPSLKQYTSCPDVVQHAIFNAQHHTGTSTGGGSGGSFLPTPVIVILVILILAAVTFGAIAVRRRRGGGPGSPGSSGGGSPGSPGGGSPGS